MFGKDKLPGQSLFTDGLWATGGRTAAVLSGLVLSMLLVRVLTPSDMGKYLIILSVVVPASTLAQLGLGVVAVRNVSHLLEVGASAQVRQVVRETAYWGGLGIVVSGIALFAAGHVLGLSLELRLIIIALMGMLAGQSLAAEILRGFHDIRSATIFGEILAKLVTVCLLAGVWIFLEHLVLDQALALILIGAITSISLSIGFVRRKLVSLPVSAEPQRISLISQSWPIWVNSLVWLVFGHIDIWILGVFCSSTEVALYGMASRLAVLLSQPQAITRSVLLPRLAAMHAQSRKRELERLVRGAGTLSGTLALIGGIGLMFGGNWLLVIIFGEIYSDGFMVLIILVLGQIVSACAGLAATTLIMTGHQRIVMITSAICSLLTASFSIWLVSLYGPLGVAGAIALGMAIQNVLMSIIAKRLLGIWTFFNPNIKEYL